MPYPVSPPALPPVADVALDQARPGSHQSSAQFEPAQFAESESLTQAAQSGSACSPEACLSSPESAFLNAALEQFPASEPPAAALSAELLGQPLMVDISSGVSGTSLQSESFRANAPQLSRQSTSQSTTFLELPELDALRQAQSAPARPALARLPQARPAQARLIQARPPQPGLRPSTAQASTSASMAEPFIQQRITQQIAQQDSSTPSGSQPESIPLDLSEPAPGIDPGLGTPSPQSPEQAQPSPNILTPDEPLSPQPSPEGGEVITIPSSPPSRPEDSAEESPDSPAPSSPPNNPDPNAPGIPVDPQAVGEVLEVRGDRQEFDERQQIFRADGNVEVRFRRGVLTADRVRVNIPNRVAVAEGNAVLTRGDQVLRGERFDYSFGLNRGSVQTARGELVIPAAERDFDPAAPTPNNRVQPVTEQVSSAQPLQVLSGLPGPSFGVGNRSAQRGQLNRLRFEADRAVFEGGGLVAENASITNDPFSPPELELRSSRVTYTRLSPTLAEIRARNPRIVFDQGFSLPLLVNRLVLDERERDPGFINFGFDERDRDGFYIERAFNIYSSPIVNFSVTPQLLIQRAINQGEYFTNLDQYGLVADLDARFTSTTTLQAIANFSSLDLSEVDDSLRMSVRAQQVAFNNHTFSLEYSYRNRLFNGSLGFQEIHSSFGLVATSPRYVLGDSLINLNYQGSIQYINAQTDQADLYNVGLPDRDLSCINPDDRDTTGNGCADLTRYQGAVTLSRLFFLWLGTTLPPTPTEGLRYSPSPILPYVGINLDTRGVYSGYSNGDHQASLRGGVTLLAQFGHFSRPVLDYTAFTLGYAKTIIDGESPFTFDRVADEQTISASLTQQIYGPLRFGVQVSYNLDTGNNIDTVYTLEYSRRTYSVSANYSTGRAAASLTFRLNDFNWTGDPGPFSGLGSGSVESGVIEN